MPICTIASVMACEGERTPALPTPRARFQYARDGTAISRSMGIERPAERAIEERERRALKLIDMWEQIQQRRAKREKLRIEGPPPIVTPRTATSLPSAKLRSAPAPETRTTRPAVIGR